MNDRVFPRDNRVSIPVDFNWTAFFSSTERFQPSRVGPISKVDVFAGLHEFEGFVESVVAITSCN